MNTEDPREIQPLILRTVRKSKIERDGDFFAVKIEDVTYDQWFSMQSSCTVFEANGLPTRESASQVLCEIIRSLPIQKL